MSPLMLSVLLSLVSAVAYAGAALVQERVAATTTDADGAGGSFAPLHRGSWWASVVLNASGALLHVVALAYGPLSLVQPLGALTIVFALPMAAVFLGRRAGRAGWRGALLSTVGLVVLLALVDPGAGRALGGTTALALAVATVAVLGVLTLAALRVRRPAARSVTLAVGSGAAFGMASVYTKDVTADFTDPLAIGMVAILAPAGLLLSQAAYRGAGLSAPLATLTVVNPVIAAAVGVTALGETVRYGALGALLAIAAGAVASAGLIQLTLQAPTDAAAAPGEAPADEAAAGAQPATGPAAPSGEPAAPVSGRVPAPAAPSDPVTPAPAGPGVPPAAVPAPSPAYHAGVAAAAALYDGTPAAGTGTGAPGSRDAGSRDAETWDAESWDAESWEGPRDPAAARTRAAGTTAAGTPAPEPRVPEPSAPRTRTPDTPAPRTPAPETPATRVPAPENAAPAGPSPAVAALIAAGAVATGGAALAPHLAACSALAAGGAAPAPPAGDPGPVPPTAAESGDSADSGGPASDTGTAPATCCAHAVPRWPHAPHRRDRHRPPRRGAGRVLDGGTRGGGQWGRSQ
ncbi:DMT family transporter [Streptomyces sp. MAR4 CNX-425]|uniref:DMT family transporter n=1 Tax=Streptomyces sp. MAR4 CNX-425 TaxID=3406343 RepID=UPI003B5077DC